MGGGKYSGSTRYFIKEVAEADALWSVLADSINREVFEAGKKLKIVANMAVGYNNIDLEAAKEHDVIVTNTPGVLTETTADLAFALLLATARKLISAENEIRKGNWTFVGSDEIYGNGCWWCNAWHHWYGTDW